MLSDLGLTELTQLMSGRALSMSAADRKILYSEMLSVLPRAELCQVVQEQLVAMTQAERGPLLAAFFGTMQETERARMQEKIEGGARNL